MSLWHALLQGVGWRLGREAAEDAIRSIKGAAREEPPETPEQRQERLDEELRAAERAAAGARKAAAEAKKAAEKKKAEDARAVERELADLKKKLGR